MTPVEMVVKKSLTAEELNALPMEAVCRFFGFEPVVEITDADIITEPG